MLGPIASGGLISANVFGAGWRMIFNVFLQNGLGFTPWHSAITTAPWAAGAFVGSAAGGIAMSKLGRRVLHAGLIIEAACRGAPGNWPPRPGPGRSLKFVRNRGSLR